MCVFFFCDDDDDDGFDDAFDGAGFDPRLAS